MSLTYENLHRAIGRVVTEWVNLEHDIAALVFMLCAIRSPAYFEDEGVGVVSGLIYSNLDVKTNIGLAKALALNADDEDESLFEDIEKVLNLVGNGLRNERNRFVHDRWFIEGDKITRYQAGIQVKRLAGSAEPVMMTGRKEFATIEDVEHVAEKIRAAHATVLKLEDRARDIYLRRYPDAE